MDQKNSKSQNLLVIALVIWVVISNGFIFFVWKGTNWFDFVIFNRVYPLVCKYEEYYYKLPNTKLSKEVDVTQEEWNTFQEVGLKKLDSCPTYDGVVWFDIISENLNSYLEEEMKE